METIGFIFGMTGMSFAIIAWGLVGSLRKEFEDLKKNLAARGESPAGRVASAVGPDARRYTADGPTPPQPEGRQRFAAAGPRYSSSPMSRHRLLLVPCQQPQIPGARLHATFTTGC